MIRVEVFSAFLIETQGFPFACFVLTTSLFVPLCEYMVFRLSPHLYSALEHFATDDSLRYEKQIYLLNSNMHLITAFSPCLSLYIVHAFTTDMSRTLLSIGQYPFLLQIEVAYLEVRQLCLFTPSILLLLVLRASGRTTLAFYLTPLLQHWRLQIG